jgi:hypothetical protein
MNEKEEDVRECIRELQKDMRTGFAVIVFLLGVLLSNFFYTFK